jgi:hypothetical protein
MQQQMDAREIMERVGEVAREFRRSNAYPVVVAGLAGGVAGALMATLIAGRRRSLQSSRVADEGAQKKGWALRDAIQLLTIVATLVRQVQAWMKEQAKA